MDYHICDIIRYTRVFNKLNGSIDQWRIDKNGLWTKWYYMSSWPFVIIGSADCLLLDSTKPLPGTYMHVIMTSSNGNIFRFTGHLCGEFTGHLVNSSHKGQWRGALMFSLIFARINRWVNIREAGDVRRHRAHYDVIVIAFRGLGLMNHGALWNEASFSLFRRQWQQGSSLRWNAWPLTHVIYIKRHRFTTWFSNIMQQTKIQRDGYSNSKFTCKRTIWLNVSFDTIPIPRAPLY